MLTFEINLDALDAQLDQIATKAQKAARLGAKAGAAVYYDAVQASAPVSGKGHWFHGTSFRAKTGRKFRDGTPRADRAGGTKYWFESGSLKGAIYQVYRKEATLNNPTYQIAWNHRQVPYGFMVVGGTKKGAKGNDFVGNAKRSATSEATDAMLFQFELAMASK